jgi:hypothetical protein
VQNRQRPRAGKAHDSFVLLKTAVAPLLADPGRTKIAARATVTRRDLDLSRCFAAILDIGFPEVGFAPLRRNSARRDDVCPRAASLPHVLGALFVLGWLPPGGNGAHRIGLWFRAWLA